MYTMYLALLQILAGELEPTTGEVILSAKALRVAFLKQEVRSVLSFDAAAALATVRRL
jgi:ATPase subunit of ABC transporter with duplicated ATPase domains